MRTCRVSATRCAAAGPTPSFLTPRPFACEVGDVYDRLPYFFSDQYEIGMECSGFVRSWDRVVCRGDPAGGEFIALWMTEDRVLAGMNVDVWTLLTRSIV